VIGIMTGPLRCGTALPADEIKKREIENTHTIASIQKAIGIPFGGAYEAIAERVNSPLIVRDGRSKKFVTIASVAYGTMNPTAPMPAILSIVGRISVQVRFAVATIALLNELRSMRKESM
jgi:hypothetical protein